MLGFLARFLQGCGQAEGGIDFEYCSQCQCHLPFGALERACAVEGHEHEGGGREQEHGTHELLAAQAADGEVIALVTGQHLHGAEHGGAGGVDEGGYPAGRGEHGERRSGYEQKSARVVDKCLQCGQFLHVRRRWVAGQGLAGVSGRESLFSTM